MVKKLLCFVAVFLCFGCSSTHVLNEIYPREVRYIPAHELNAEKSWDLKTCTSRVEIARRLMGKGFHEVALRQLKEEVKGQGTNSAEILYLIGICEREMGDKHKAKRSFQAALRYDANYAPAYDGLGVVCFLEGYLWQAEKFFKKAVELDPGRADFQNNLGFLYLHKRNFLLAEKRFRRCLSIDPNFTKAINNLGSCLALLAREEEALAVFQEIMSKSEALNNMGVVFEVADQEAKALEYYQKAVRAEPSLTIAQNNLKRFKKIINRTE